MQGLMMHRGGREVTRDDLATLPAPVSLGRFHRPIPHVEVVDAILETFGRSFEIQKTAFGVSRDGGKLFGLITATDGQSLGFRSSTDESLAIKGVAGQTVFVCDNLVLSGEDFVFSHKSTLNATLGAIIGDGVLAYLTARINLEAAVARMKERELEFPGASELFVCMILKAVVPAVYVSEAVRNYFQPEGKPDCQPRSVYGVHNALTRALRTAPIAARFEHSMAVTRYLSA
jgi:hypothetical protein